MLRHAGISGVDPAEVLADGRAHEVWCRMITAQGGDPEAALPQAAHVDTITAPASGTVTGLDAHVVGLAAWRLGAGRARKEDTVDHAAGVLCLAKPGERVTEGQPLLELRTDRPETLPAVRESLQAAYEISGADVKSTPLILDKVTAGRSSR
jgi:thymidine phosphorylase